MKHARKNILNPDFIQNTRNNQQFRYQIISHENKNKRLHCYQILTIITFIPDKHAKTLFRGTFS